MSRVYTIYLLKFPNGKAYVGQTCKTAIQRFHGHKTDSRRSKPKTLVAQAIKKYGEDSVCISVIDTAENKKQADEKEIYYIQLYNTFKNKNGYNYTTGGDGFRSTHSEKTRKLISDHHKKFNINNTWALEKFYQENPEKRSEIQKKFLKDNPEYKQRLTKMSREQRALGKLGKPKVPVALVKGELILEFDNISEAAKSIKCSISAISMCVIGRNKSVKGFKVYRLDKGN